MRRAVVLVIACVAALLAGHAVAQPVSCNDEETKRKGLAVDAVRQGLMASTSNDELEVDVPEPAQLGLTELKARLGAFIAAYMACAPAGASAAAIEPDLLALSNAGSPRAGVSAARYGTRLEFKVRLLRERPALLGVVAEFDIWCGSDALLAIFAAADAGWTEVLRYHSEPYDTVAGGFGWFDYAVSPTDERGQWYAVARHVRPWCTSNWSMIDYAVLRSQPDTVRPRVLMEDSEEIWWSEQQRPPGAATLAFDGFDLTFPSQSMDPQIFIRTWVRSFSVTGDLVRRRDPVALNVRDFADEWIRADWQQAGAWLEDGAPTVEAVHRRLHEQRNFEYVSIRGCSDTPGHVQVELLGEWDRDRYFLHVVSRGLAMRLRAIDREPAPACDGEDLLPAMATR